MAKYVARLTEPSYTDKNYIHYDRGGYNYCIHIGGGSVLPNCVGYAWGRWREFLGKYHNLSRGNAENWWGYTQDGYSRGQTPKLGAVVCWSKGRVGVESDGAGHVGIVEIINKDNIVVSMSAYGGTRWFTRTFPIGQYNYNSFVFQGFIYPPVNFTEEAETSSSTDKTTVDGKVSTLTFKVGDIVEFKGDKHYESAVASTGKSVKASKAKITATSAGSKHQYHVRAVNDKGSYISGVYGWVDASTLSKVKTTASASTSSSKAIADGTKLTLKNVSLFGSSSSAAKAATKTGVYYVWSKDVVNNRIRITNSKTNVGKNGQVTGWISYADAQKSIGTTTTSNKSLDDWAKEVIQGKHGNGIENRTASLKKAGCPYTYQQVQDRVNKLI